MTGRLPNHHFGLSTATGSVQDTSMYWYQSAYNTPEKRADISPSSSRLELLPRRSIGRGSIPFQSNAHVHQKCRPRPASHIVLAKPPETNHHLVNFMERNKQQLSSTTKKEWKHLRLNQHIQKCSQKVPKHQFIRKGQGQSRIKKIKPCRIPCRKECCQQLERIRLAQELQPKPVNVELSMQRMAVYTPMVFRPETLIKENKFMKHVQERVLDRVASYKEILESLFILRDRIHLLLSPCGLEISRKQPIVLNGHPQLQVALEQFQEMKELFKNVIGADEVCNNANTAVANEEETALDIPSKKAMEAESRKQYTPSYRKEPERENFGRGRAATRNRYSHISRGQSLKYSGARPITDNSGASALSSESSKQYITSNSAIVFAKKKHPQLEVSRHRITEESIGAGSIRSTQLMEGQQINKIETQEAPVAGGKAVVTFKFMISEELIPSIENIPETKDIQKSRKEISSISKILLNNRIPLGPLNAKAVRQNEEQYESKKRDIGSRKQIGKLLEQIPQPVLQRKATKRQERRLSPPTSLGRRSRRWKHKHKIPLDMTSAPNSQQSIHSNNSAPHKEEKHQSVKGDNMSRKNSNVDLECLEFCSLRSKYKATNRLRKDSSQAGRSSFMVNRDQHRVSNRTRTDIRTEQRRFGICQQERFRYLRVNPKDSFVKNRLLIYEQCERLQKFLSEDSEEITQLSQLLHQHLNPVVAPTKSRLEDPQKIEYDLEKLLNSIRETTTINEAKKCRLLEFMQHFIKCKFTNKQEHSAQERGYVEVEIEQVPPTQSIEKQTFKQLEGKLLKFFCGLPREFESETLQQKAIGNSGRLQYSRVARKKHHNPTGIMSPSSSGQ